MPFDDTPDVITDDTRTAVGIRAGNDLNNETALGFQAGRNNTGEDSTVTGQAAGLNNTGEESTITGVSAGRNNTGNFSTMTGVSAGRNNTGNFSTMTGVSAGLNNTGKLSTMTGQAAGLNNTGDNSTMTGQAAGRGDGLADPATMGDDNIGIGVSAIRDNQASGLIAIGQEAGRNATTDDQLIITDRNGNRRLQMDLTTGDLSIEGSLTQNASL